MQNAPWPMGPCSANACFDAEITADNQIRVWSTRYLENGSIVFDRDEFDRFIAEVKTSDKWDHLVSADAEKLATT